jgi:D-proline reductase (dithiol) PrdB
MAVDSFKYLPRSFRPGFESVGYQHDEPAWTTLETPIEEATIALLSSAGIYIEGQQQPFDLDRERANPNWGDPTYRVIPRDVPQERVRVAHLHINGRDIERDINVALPLRAFAELESEGRIGQLADEHYSFMGFQHRSLADWRGTQIPELAGRLKEAGVSALVLAPA